MILPGSQLFNLLLLVFGMLCLGTWANTFKMTSRWRFELYYFDFAIGVLVAAVALGLSLGSLGWDGFALSDDISNAAKQKDAFAMAAGVVFNLGNMLVLGALSIAGVTVGYMIGLGVMLTSGMLILQYTSPSGNGAMLGAGALLVAIAAVLLAYSARVHSMERLMLLMREGKTKSTRKSVSIKGSVLAIGGGIIASGYFPLAKSAGEGETGLGPYSLGIFFAIGIGLSTLVFSLFFMNLPINGPPLELTAYFEGKAKSHWLGVLGGIMWYLGLASTLIAARAESKNMVSPVAGRALLLGAALIGTLWGLLRWKEFQGAGGKVRALVLVAVVVFVVGIVGLSVSAGISNAG